MGRQICTVTGFIITGMIVIQDKVLDPLLFFAFSFLLRLHGHGEARIRGEFNGSSLPSVSHQNHCQKRVEC